MDPALRELIQQALSTIIQALAVAVLGIATMAAKKLMEKYNVTLSDRQQEVVKELAKSAIFYAEEWAAKKGGAVAGANGDWKLKTATRYMLSVNPALTQVVATTSIHAALGSIQGLGASKTVGVALAPAQGESAK